MKEEEVNDKRGSRRKIESVWQRFGNVRGTIGGKAIGGSRGRNGERKEKSVRKYECKRRKCGQRNKYDEEKTRGNGKCRNQNEEIEIGMVML